MSLTYMEKLTEATTYLKEQGVSNPEFGLVLGSGLGELADEVVDPIKISYSEIPHFPVSTVTGHAGQLVYGKLNERQVLIMQGRFHYYEGYQMEQVILPIRVMHMLGIESMIVTNAAGGVNVDFTPGNLMLITDHINYMGTNPLIGKNEHTLGTRFPDMSEAYDKAYQATAKLVAKNLNIDLQSGVYMGFTGPTYETPAEIKMARVLGADAVGMSTVPEVIVAKHMQMRVLGISCITNLAAGMQSNLNHAEVVETTERVKETFKELVKEILKEL